MRTISLKINSLMAVGRIPADLSISSSLHIAVSNWTTKIPSLNLKSKFGGKAGQYVSYRSLVTKANETKEALIVHPGVKQYFERDVSPSRDNESVLFPKFPD